MGIKNSKKSEEVNKGITLIALVITIIVLLILAAISIATLTGENGILTKSKQAVEEHKKEEYEETIKLIGMALQADKQEKNWSTETYMDQYAEEIRKDILFEEAQVEDPVLYEGKLIIEVKTKEGWLFWVTESKIEYKETGEIPKIEPTDVYPSLEGNTLKFYSTESEAKANGGKVYGNIRDREFVRVSWGKADTPWQEDKDAIQKVEFINEIAPINMANYFYFLTNLTEVKGIENLKTDNVTSMYATFGGCSKLTSLDVSKFNTRKVTNMNSMFYNCKFSTIDVSNFNTRNVIDMNSMFSTCDNLESLDISNFNTSKVINMGYMFQSAKKLTSLDVSNFDTRNVTDMNSMFCACENLESLDVSNFNTSKVTNMGYMFSICDNLKNLDLSNFNTSNVTDMNSMFHASYNLKSLDLSNFNTSNVTNMRAMFNACKNLENLDVSNFDTNNVTDMYQMFLNCNNITELNVSNFNTENVTNMQEMFSCCYKLKKLDVSNFNTQNVENYTYMFFACYQLRELNCQGFIIKTTAPIPQMFDQCQLQKLDIRKFELENHTANKNRVFEGIQSTAEIITNQKMKEWLNTNYSKFTNIITIDE